MKKKEIKNNKSSSLLNLKISELKDITLLDLSYRDVISFSLLGEEIPILLKLEDIKYKDVRNDLTIRGVEVPALITSLSEKGNNLIVDYLFRVIDWDLFDIINSDIYYSDLAREIKENNTVNGIENRLKIDKSIKELENEIKYNLKCYIVDRCQIDTEIQTELLGIYHHIHNIQRDMITEFRDVLDKIMKYDDDKAISFGDYFQVMLKTSIVNSVTPIFKENIGKAFVDYSFREIELRIAFERKETLLNANRMKLMLPTSFMRMM